MALAGASGHSLICCDDVHDVPGIERIRFATSHVSATTVLVHVMPHVRCLRVPAVPDVLFPCGLGRGGDHDLLSTGTCIRRCRAGEGMLMGCSLASVRSLPWALSSLGACAATVLHGEAHSNLRRASQSVQVLPCPVSIWRQRHLEGKQGPPELSSAICATALLEPWPISQVLEACPCCGLGFVLRDAWASSVQPRDALLTRLRVCSSAASGHGTRIHCGAVPPHHPDNSEVHASCFRQF